LSRSAEPDLAESAASVAKIVAAASTENMHSLSATEVQDLGSLCSTSDRIQL
jgi:hypothetical protein